MTAEALAALRAGGKPAMARALAALEAQGRDPQTIALLDAAFADPKGRSLGLTGPPGVGKSSLTDGLLREARSRGLTVGAIAVDPSSLRSGGALLGDRARLSSLDPGDQGVFVRSMASRGRLGGLSALAYPAMVVMQAAYDLVLVETVGVGQSEVEVAGLADALLLCIQPASGDSLQFMKAGIVEMPDIAAVTKSDLGAPARRAAADLRSALATVGGEAPQIRLCSSRTGEGIGELFDSILDTLKVKAPEGDNGDQRLNQASRWLKTAIQAEFGTEGVRLLGARIMLRRGMFPFGTYDDVSSRLRNALAEVNLNGGKSLNNP